jgi:hypothetical protein
MGYDDVVASMKHRLVDYISAVTDKTIEIPFQEALFPVCREIQPRYEPVEIRVFHPEDGGDMLSETSVIARTTRYHIPEDNIFLLTTISEMDCLLFVTSSL